jgi:hypothetical protein
MSTVFHEEYDTQLVAVLAPLTTAGVWLYRQPTAPALSFDAVWIPLRPVLRVWEDAAAAWDMHSSEAFEAELVEAERYGPNALRMIDAALLARLGIAPHDARPG